VSDAEVRLYKFLVKMKRITREEFENITGLDYDV